MDRMNGYLDSDDYINIESFIRVRNLKFDPLQFFLRFFRHVGTLFRCSAMRKAQEIIYVIYRK